MIISTDAEKAFDKIQHPFMIKALMKLRIEVMYFKIIKGIYDNPTADIIPNGEKHHTKARNKEHSPGIPSQSIKTGRRDKRNSNRKGRSQTILCTDNMILCLKDPEQKTPRHHKHLQQSSRTQNQLQKSVAFVYNNNEQIEKEYRKTIPFTVASKKYLRINLTKEVKDLFNEN
jgi:hypothetical protein